MKCSLIAATLSPVVLDTARSIQERSILRRLVPRDEIEALADEAIRRHPTDPEEWVFIEDEAAWFRSHNFKQGKWHRVRKAIRRRLLASDLPPSA